MASPKLFAKDEPVITSLLDLDFYKLTMLQIIWKYYRNVPVLWSFLNRTPGVSLAQFVTLKELREQTEHIRTLRFTDVERKALGAVAIGERKIFAREFLDDLASLQLPEVEIEKAAEGNGVQTYSIHVAGSWYETTLWETFFLSTANELRCRNEARASALSNRSLLREAERLIQEKIDLLNSRPRTSAGDLITIAEFGTRRRLSGAMQDRVVETWLAQSPQHLQGTSNVLRAMRYGIKPVGTMAHEMFLVLYGVASANGFHQPAHIAHRQVLDLWCRMYGESLAIALTDTWGTDFFLRNFPAKQAERWHGFRLDSGNLIAAGERILAHLHELQKQGCSVCPKETLLLASDGMTIPAIIEFCEHFAGRAKTTGALGTNATFDVGPMLKPWSMVMKVTEAAGCPAPKLSDNPAKATGDPEEIERAKREVGYEDRPAQPVVY